jgi:phosphate transport system permease protein
MTAVSRDPDSAQAFKHNPSSSRALFGLMMNSLTVLAAVLALLPLLALLVYVLFQGFAQLNLDVFRELPPPPGVKGGGFGNAIIGTLVMVALGACFSIPVGVMAAVYLSEFAGNGSTAVLIRFATNILSGVPSIVVGVFGFAVVVLQTGTFSAVAGGFALSILMLPIITRTTEEALKLVPEQVRQAAIGLGATNFQTVFWVVLPAAVPAIVTGVMLGIARAAGETAPLIFTALFSQFWNRGLLEPTASLSVLIYNFATVPFKNQQALAWAASLVLILMVLVTSILSRLVTRRRTY